MTARGFITMWVVIMLAGMVMQCANAQTITVKRDSKTSSEIISTRHVNAVTVEVTRLHSDGKVTKELVSIRRTIGDSYEVIRR
jgi:hypothetical protein